MHMHGGGFKAFYQRIGPLRKAIVRFTLKRTSLIVALSEEWREFYAALARDSDVILVPNAVLLPEQSRLQKSRSSHFNIIYLGKVSEAKGAFDLIRAMPSVGGDAILEIAGTGDTAAAEDLAKALGVADRVRFFGWVDPAGREAMLANADLLALPSYAEGLPMSVLEGMAYGLPVITTPVGGIPSLVKDGQNGLLVQPGDVMALAEAIERVRVDTVLAEWLGQSARETIKERFDARTFGRSIQGAYAKLLAEADGSS